MADWTRTLHLAPRLVVHYPTATASGEPVELDQTEREGIRRIWIRSPDRQEIYFEAVTYPGRADHLELWASQRRFHLTALGRTDPWIDDPASAVLLSLPATRYDLGWTDHGRPMQRTCHFADLESCTIRVIFDPRSPTNHEILARLAFSTAPAPNS